MTTLGQRLRRLRPFPLGALALVWVLLWGTWSVGNVLNGLLLAAFVLVLLPLPEVSREGRVHVPSLLRYAGGFLSDLVVSSIQVSWLAVRPGPQQDSSVVACRLRSNSEVIMTMTAETLSLVPGSIIIEVDPPQRTLYAHVLAADDDAAVTAFRRRVLDVEAAIIRAVGRDADRALLGAAGSGARR